MVHQRLEWFLERSKKAQRHSAELHSFIRLQSWPCIAEYRVATRRPIAPTAPDASGSRRGRPSGAKRIRSRLVVAASLRAARSTGEPGEPGLAALTPRIA